MPKPIWLIFKEGFIIWSWETFSDLVCFVLWIWVRCITCRLTRPHPLRLLYCLAPQVSRLMTTWSPWSSAQWWEKSSLAHGKSSVISDCKKTAWLSGTRARKLEMPTPPVSRANKAVNRVIFQSNVLYYKYNPIDRGVQSSSWRATFLQGLSLEEISAGRWLSRRRNGEPCNRRNLRLSV